MSVKYIEFIGPGGAGKSTISKALIQSKRFYGGYVEDAIEREFLDDSSLQRKIAHQVITPVGQKYLCDFILEPRYRNTAFKEFVFKYPNYLQVLRSILSELSFEPEFCYSWIKDVAERYQLGINTISQDEIFVFDGGFSQRAEMILSRTKTKNFHEEQQQDPLQVYLETVPKPDLLVHIDAPAEVLMKRQRARGQTLEHNSKKWSDYDFLEAIETVRSYCDDLRNEYDKKTDVLYIKNIGEIDAIVSEISQRM